jgi:hypothetical protein
MSLLFFLVITGITGDLALWWLVPLLGVGLPTVGLVSALLGLFPRSRPSVQVIVRLLPANGATFVKVEALPLGSGLYRIISANRGSQPWEFAPGETVQCSEQALPNGERGLVAIMRV